MHKIGAISRTEAFRSFAVQCHTQQPAQPPISRGPPRDFQYVIYQHTYATQAIAWHHSHAVPSYT